MGKEFTRDEIIARINEIVREKKPVLITSAGIGISAKFEELAGSDMIMLTNGSYLRMDGHSSIAELMPYGNANDIVVKLAERISPVITNIPMVAGVCGTDPTTEMESHLETLKFLGFSAVINSPSVGITDRVYRKELERAGFGYEKEVSMLKLASDKGLYTIGRAYDADQAKLLCDVKVDAVVCDVGYTADPGASAAGLTIMQAADVINEMADIIREKRPDAVLLAHGGPILTREDAVYIYEHTMVSGLLAESIVERIPVEKPLTDEVRKFKNIDIEKGEL